VLAVPTRLKFSRTVPYDEASQAVDELQSPGGELSKQRANGSDVEAEAVIQMSTAAIYKIR